MPEENPKPASEETPKHRHESRDANIRGVIIFGIVLFVTIVISMWLSDVTFDYFASHQSLGPKTTPYGEVHEAPPKGVPRLEVHGGQDMEIYLKQQEKKLNSYGWVDKDRGIVRIPIQRAMDLLLKKGLPVRTGPPQEGIVDPIQEDHQVPKGYMPQN